jgi:hypothetical protein
VLCDEIDLCDTDFHQAAVQELESGVTDLVIGSKLIAGARDQRPMVRHREHRVYGLLRGCSASAARTRTASRRSGAARLADWWRRV